MLLAVSIWSSTGSEHARSLEVDSQAPAFHSSEYRKGSTMKERAIGDRIFRSDRSDKLEKPMDDSVRGSTSVDIDRKVNRAISSTLANCKWIATFMWMQQLFSGRILAKDRTCQLNTYVKYVKVLLSFELPFDATIFDTMLSACVRIRS